MPDARIEPLFSGFFAALKMTHRVARRVAPHTFCHSERSAAQSRNLRLFCKSCIDRSRGKESAVYFYAQHRLHAPRPFAFANGLGVGYRLLYGRNLLAPGCMVEEAPLGCCGCTPFPDEPETGCAPNCGIASPGLPITPYCILLLGGIGGTPTPPAPPDPERTGIPKALR